MTNNNHTNDKTIVPLREAAAYASQSNSMKPEFIRLPKPGTPCPISGLNRTTMYQLCTSGQIRSVVLRQRGAARGIRLLNYDSLIAFLRGLEAEQCAEQKEAA